MGYLEPKKSFLNYFGSRIMKEKSLNRLLEKQCKIVTKEPGNRKNRAFIGIIKEIAYDEGFIIIESDRGTGCLNIKSIVAIKPCQQHGH